MASSNTSLSTPTTSGPRPTPSRVTPIRNMAVPWARREAGNRWVMAPKQGTDHQVPKKAKPRYSAKAVGTARLPSCRADPAGQRKDKRPNELQLRPPLVGRRLIEKKKRNN